MTFFNKLRGPLVLSAALFTGWLIALAQQPGGMSMGDMMKSCQEHCRMTSASIDNINKVAEEAKRTNDPAKMRQALDEVQKPLASMKEHMTMCMNMMGMMQKMQSGQPAQKK
jgi:hypothetical protein